jgi:pimeloyl-ACP methyl ester carboxylesterase
VLTFRPTYRQYVRMAATRSRFRRHDRGSSASDAPPVVPGEVTGSRPAPATAATAGALAAEYAERLILGTVRDVHRAVARRVFKLTFPVSLPTRLVHDGISSAVYGVIGTGLRTTESVLDTAHRRGRGGPELESLRVGRRGTAIVNGLIGAALAQESHPMAIEMTARVDGRDVTDFAADYPDATGDVVVFLHGLTEDDESWRWGAVPGGPTYAERLRADTSWTPVLLRYNTGLSVIRNGELLSDLLSRLVREWPTRVRRIALVGHSMGGLVALAACQHAGCEQQPPLEWTTNLKHVVCLGTPHLGAPLEQLVYHGARLLSVLPESTPFATILNTRSAGILDLRQAVLDCQPLEGVRYHCFSASLRGPLGLLVGDLLVRPASAVGRIPGATFQLLNHPEVYADLRRRLSSDPPDPDLSLLGSTG